MAITRAQQYRQMLKDGKVAMQGGGPNYLGKQKTVSNVPIKWQSGPNKPPTELAYITEAEKKLLLKEDIHGSLKDGPNKGPKGIISLNGDLADMEAGITGADISAAERGEGPRGAMDQDRADEFRAGFIAAGGNEGSTKGESEKVKKEVEEIKKASAKRKRDARRAITKEEKKEARLNQKRIKQRLEKDKIRRQERLKGIFSGAEQFSYVDPITGETITEDLNPGGLTDMEKNELAAFGITDIGPKTELQQDLIDQFLEKSDKFSGAEMEAFKENFNTPDLPGVLGLGLNIASPFLKKGSRKTKDFFTDDVLGAGKFTYKGQTVTPEMFQYLSPTEMQEVYGDYMNRRQGNEIDAYGNPIRQTGGPDQQMEMDPCKGPNPPAYCFVNQDPTTPTTPTPTRNLGGLAPRFTGSIFDFTGMADGGRVPAMDGGIMNADVIGGAADGNIDEMGRQMYFVGKLVKKATRAVKKIAKSPIGKIGLMYGLGAMGGSLGAGKGLFSKGMFNPSTMMKGLLGVKTTHPVTGKGMEGLLGKLGITGGFGAIKPTLGGGLALGLGVPLALDLMGVGKDDDDDKMDLDEYYRSQGINIADIRLNPYNYLAPRFAADGGLMRMGYQEGGDAEPVAKKTMPLIDMDGKEKDYRETGGFVDMGRMERADDVPARLSKNEFVFTADAVRNAGEGDIDKGAEVMYNMMKNLEAGGEVSEESQGLEGARNMFQTSQRLEEVL